MKLFFEAIAKLLFGAALVGLLIFLPTGTLSFFGGRLFMGILFIPMILAGIVMLFKDPKLLRKRLSVREKEKSQGQIVKLSGLMFVLGFIVSGLTFRFDLYVLPPEASIAGAVVFLLGYVVYAEVLRENAYLSRVIEVQQGQKVIDTGLYGIVRHPMYSATLVMFLSIPVILGSLYSLPVFAFYPILIIKRLKNEEKLLEEELSGYTEYKKRVRYRLLPFVY